jgi:GNAT superfamily N-acetyltransferase
MNIRLESDPSDEDKQTVLDGLDAYNAAHGVPVDFEPISIFARDDDGAVRGGLLGETFWQWFHISILWIAEEARGQGLGSRILEMAEAEAVRRGCFAAIVSTLSFQAPSFYLEHGYTEWGKLEDLPRGHRRIHLQKRLGEP